MLATASRPSRTRPTNSASAIGRSSLRSVKCGSAARACGAADTGQLVRRRQRVDLGQQLGRRRYPREHAPAAPLRAPSPRAAAPMPRPIAALDARASRLPFAATSWPDPFAFSAAGHRLGVTPPKAGSRLAGSPRPAFS